MHFTRALVASCLAIVATAQTPTSLSDAQESKVIKDLASYLSSLAAQPEYTSNAQVVLTAIPASDLSEIGADPTDYLSQIVTSTPTWFTALPSNVQSYYNSVASAEQSIYNKDVKGPAPTVGPRVKVVAAMGAAAGAVAMAI